MTERLSLSNWRSFSRASRLESMGKTTVLVRTDGVFLDLLALADAPRPDTREAFDQLADFGAHPAVMLTGDNEQVAKAVATSVGISDVRAGLLPEDKLKVIDELLKDYGQVAMGGAGTDLALETADVELTADG